MAPPHIVFKARPPWTPRHHHGRDSPRCFGIASPPGREDLMAYMAAISDRSSAPDSHLDLTFLGVRNPEKFFAIFSNNDEKPLQFWGTIVLRQSKMIWNGTHPKRCRTFNSRRRLCTSWGHRVQDVKVGEAKVLIGFLSQGSRQNLHIWWVMLMGHPLHLVWWVWQITWNCSVASRQPKKSSVGNSLRSSPGSCIWHGNMMEHGYNQLPSALLTSPVMGKTFKAAHGDYTWGKWCKHGCFGVIICFQSLRLSPGDIPLKPNSFEKTPQKWYSPTQ